ncbi:MAG: hypothetical protein RLN83_08125 [Balneola sp.]
MSDQKQELKPVKTLSHITDEETGEVVEITSDLRDEALQVHGQIEGAFWQLATALSRIKNDKLFLALGYTSFKGYCKDTLPFGVRNAYHYAIVGERIGARLLESNKSTNPGSQSKLEEMGIKRLRLIATKAEDQIESLINEGKISLDDIDLTSDDIANMTVKALKDQLEKEKTKSGKYELVSEQKKMLELEKEVLLKEQEEFKKRDQKYREASVTYDEMERDIVDATEAFAEAQKLLNRIETSLVPKQLGPRLKLLIETIQNAGVDIAETHSEVMFKYDEGL